VQNEKFNPLLREKKSEKKAKKKRREKRTSGRQKKNKKRSFQGPNEIEITK